MDQQQMTDMAARKQEAYDQRKAAAERAIRAVTQPAASEPTPEARTETADGHWLDTWQGG